MLILSGRSAGSAVKRLRKIELDFADDASSGTRYAPVDFVEVRAAIVDLLFQRSLDSSAVVADFKGRWGKWTILRALRYLHEDGVIERRSNRYPWKIKQQRSPSEK